MPNAVAGGLAGEWNKQFLENFFLVPWSAQQRIEDKNDAAIYWDAHRLDDPDNPLPAWNAPHAETEKAGQTYTMEADFTPQNSGRRYIGLLKKPPVWATHLVLDEGVWVTVIDPWFVCDTNGGEPPTEDGYERILLTEYGASMRTETYETTVTWTAYGDSYSCVRQVKVTQDLIGDYSRFNKISGHDIPNAVSQTRDIYLDNNKMIGFGENQSANTWLLKCYAIFESDMSSTPEEDKILAWGYLTENAATTPVEVHGAQESGRTQGEMPIFRKNKFKVTFGSLSEEIT